MKKNPNLKGVFKNPTIPGSENKLNENLENCDDYETINKEYLKAQEEHKQILEDLKEYEIKSKLRENELQNYLKILKEKLKTRDVNIIKNKLSDISYQIQDGILKLENKAKDEIYSCKNEIFSRSQLRIMDSENRYLENVKYKSDEQEDLIKEINSCTQEMEKVKLNYLRVKNNLDIFYKENMAYKSVILDLELKNAKSKMELLKFKKYINHVKFKLANKKQKEYEYQEESLKDDKETFKSRENSLQSQPILINKHLGIDKIKELLTNENYLKTFPKLCGTISSLANILENSKIKLKKLKFEVENEKLNCDLAYRVYNHILENKLNKISNSSFVVKIRQEGLKSNKNINNIFLNKDERENFIHSLVTNPVILDIIENNKLPNLIVAKRKISN